MSERLTTDVELADMLGITVEDVHLKCRSSWPRVKPKRSVWRFTEAMVQQIIEMESVAPTRPSVIASAQTSRSRARAS